MPSEKVDLRSLGFVVPNQSIGPKTPVCRTSRISTRLHDSHEHCCVPSSCVGLALSLDTFPCRDAVMFFCASDESQRLSPSRRWCSCFTLRFISRVSSTNGFSANPENAPSIAGSGFAMAATNSKMEDHSLHSVSRPEMRIHLPCGCHCRLNSCELLRAVGANPPVPGPISPPLPYSIRTTIQHTRSATLFQVPCCNVWI